MSGEVQFSFQSGKQTYFIIRNRIGQIWNTSSLAFESYSTGSYANYAISATEQGSASAYYVGNFPTAIAAGVYYLLSKQQIGGSPAETDPTIGVGNFDWNGVVALPLSDLATSGQIGQMAPIRIARGTQIPSFPFKLVSSADHITPFVSGIVSGQISRDGGFFGALQSGNVSEIGKGWYSVPITSGDILANGVALLFTANGVSGGTSDQRDFAFILQRTSGQ